MAYIDRNLTKGETVVLRARPGWFGLVFAWIVPIVLAIVTFVVRGSIGDNNEMIGNILWIPLGVVTLFFIFKAIKLTIAFVCSELALTNKRVIGKKGVLTSGSVDLPLDKVQSISVSSKLLGKIFNSGNIEIHSAGQDIIWPNISRAEEFKRATMAQIDQFNEDKMKEQAEQMATAMSKAMKG